MDHLLPHSDDDTVQDNAFTNRIFTENYEKTIIEDLSRNESKMSHKQVVATKRIRELQILGCIIVEIFMAKQLRAMGMGVTSLNFNQRLCACLTIVKACKEQIPNCIKYAIELLLQTKQDQNDGFNYFDNFRYPTVTEKGKFTLFN